MRKRYQSSTLVVELIMRCFVEWPCLLGKVTNLSNSKDTGRVSTRICFFLLIRISVAMLVPDRNLWILRLLPLFSVSVYIVVIIVAAYVNNIHVNVCMIATDENLVVLGMQRSKHWWSQRRLLMIVLRWYRSLKLREWRLHLIWGFIRFLKILLLPILRALIVIYTKDPLTSFEFTLSW